MVSPGVVFPVKRHVDLGQRCLSHSDGMFHVLCVAYCNVRTIQKTDLHL